MSGIYIPNMEMPKNCIDCPCYYPEYYECNIVHNCNPISLDDPIPQYCPLVEVPKHGRLIDADEFLKRAIGTKCFRGDYALMLEELVGESTTIIESEG